MKTEQKPSLPVREKQNKRQVKKTLSKGKEEVNGMNYRSKGFKAIETDLLTERTRIVKPKYVSDYFRERGQLTEAQVRYTGKLTVEVDFTISGDNFSDVDDPGPEILGDFFQDELTFGKVTNQDIKMEIINHKHLKLLD